MQEELDYLRARIKLLEDRVRGLRLSRLVLMNLLTTLEKKQPYRCFPWNRRRKGWNARTGVTPEPYSRGT